MNESLAQFLTLLYGLTGVIGMVAYWPTYSDLRKNIPSANLNTYLLWVVTSGVSFLYGLFVTNDPTFRTISGVNFVICLFLASKITRVRKRRVPNPH